MLAVRRVNRNADAGAQRQRQRRLAGRHIESVVLTQARAALSTQRQQRLLAANVMGDDGERIAAQAGPVSNRMRANAA